MELSPQNIHNKPLLCILFDPLELKSTLLLRSTSSVRMTYLLVAVRSSEIWKGNQKLDVTFNSDKLGGIDFTKFSKLTVYSAKEEA